MKNHAMFTRILNNFLIEVWILISVISTSLNACLAEAVFKFKYLLLTQISIYKFILFFTKILNIHSKGK